MNPTPVRPRAAVDRTTLRCVICLLLMTHALRLPAITFTLVPEADTTLFETFPGNNMGGVQTVASGVTANGFKSRALFRFDIAGNIPSNAVITSASLTLKVVMVPLGGGINSDFALHRAERDWGEGNKVQGDPVTSTGAAATAGEATWLARFHPLSLWTAPGAAAPADYAPAPTTTQFVSGLGTYTFTSLAADVQAWLTNSAGNFGWILISQREDPVTDAGTARRFGSRESVTNAPVLVVECTICPEITIAEFSGNQFKIGFEAQAGHAYVVECRDSFSVPGWTMCTNLPPPAVTGPIEVLLPITGPVQFYRVGAQ